MRELESELDSVNESIKGFGDKYDITSDQFSSSEIPSGITEDDIEEWEELIHYRELLKNSINSLKHEVERMEGSLSQFEGK